MRRRRSAPHGGQCLLGLCYEEDKDADVDSNIVMTESGQFVEVQSSGEESTFSPSDLEAMLAFGKKGIIELVALQEAVIASAMKPADSNGLKGLAEMFKRKARSAEDRSWAAWRGLHCWSACVSKTTRPKVSGSQLVAMGPSMPGLIRGM